MTLGTLTYLAQQFAGLGLMYQYMRWNGDVRYPYWIGEFTEQPESDEGGKRLSTFMLTGTAKGTWNELLATVETIKERFREIRTILPSGMGVYIVYDNMLTIPNDNSELKRVQINLSITEFRSK